MNQTEETYSGDSYWYHEDILNVTVSNSTSVFQSPLSPLVDKAISCITIIILFITMVSLGCTMEISKIKAHILKPKGVAIAVVAQYGIMPLTAFTLAKVFQLGSIESVTVLICGCCPGGNLSNIFALALKGDMNLSRIQMSCKAGVSRFGSQLAQQIASGEPPVPVPVPYRALTGQGTCKFAMALLISGMSCTDRESFTAGDVPLDSTSSDGKASSRGQSVLAAPWGPKGASWAGGAKSSCSNSARAATALRVWGRVLSRSKEENTP
ncbi:UNVERIFIED_CONTAM: hypothetical protein FKN15_012812 [Acipenser sinensis]